MRFQRSVCHSIYIASGVSNLVVIAGNFFIGVLRERRFQVSLGRQ